MALRNPTLASFPSRMLNTFSPSQQCVRCLHKNVPAGTVPPPTPFVPDVPTFLSLIGRQMSKHASKFSSWDDLFTMSSDQLRDAGIEPTKQRRYLLRWRDKFRRGEYGIGGDLQNVRDGVAEIRVIDVLKKQQRAKEGEGNAKGRRGAAASKEEPQKVTASITSNPGVLKRVVNLPPGQTTVKDPNKVPPKPRGFSLCEGMKVKAPYMKPLKGSGGTAGTLQAQEGMWEDKLGRKIDGGERRRAEVRAKKRAEERKKAM